MEKQKVWVPDPVEGFILGTIQDIGHNGEATILTADSKRSKVICNLEQICYADQYDQMDVEDNCKNCCTKKMYCFYINLQNVLSVSNV